MEKYIFNESNGLWYELVGDYYLPCLKLPDDQPELNLWAQQYKNWLKANNRLLYAQLLNTDKLYHHCAEVGDQAEKMYLQLVEQMAQREGITEQLKADNQMEWVRAMNSIANRAKEIVRHELIYV